MTDGYPVPCRLALDDEVPTTARRIMRNASAAGWTAQATYASSGEHCSVVVRLGHPHGHRAAAWWTDGKADDAAVRVLGIRGGAFERFVGVTGLERLLKVPKRPKGYVPADPGLVDPDELDEHESEPEPETEPETEP